MTRKSKYVMLHAFAFTNPAVMLRKVLDVLPFLVLVKRIVCLVSILFLSVTYLQERKVILGLHLYPCGKGKVSGVVVIQASRHVDYEDPTIFTRLSLQLQL